MAASFAGDLTAASIALPRYWEHTVGSGHATLALHADRQSQLRRTHAELGMAHVRFHGLLSDDMRTLIGEGETLFYSFFNADQICDFLLSIGMKPFVEPSFMPSILASGSKTVFHYRANVMPPKDYAQWAILIRKLVQHWVECYGGEEARRWFFEVWNEPNLTAFGSGKQSEYFELYRYTVDAIKGIDNELKVGGPATADNAWVSDFPTFCGANALPADFVTTHHYPTDAFGKPGDDIVQNDPKFLPREERDAAELLSLALSRDGVVTRLNTTVVGARCENGEKWIDTVNNGVKESIPVDSILLSIGRVPNLEELNLDAAGIAIGSANDIQIDDFLCTTNADVYAAGDACKAHKFANVAEASAHVAVLNAFGRATQRQSHLTIPWCTYCDPEFVHIGMHIKEARRRGIIIRSFTVMMQDVDRAITDGQDEGFVKMYVRAGTDEILGATIVAARASEMINEMSVIMHTGIGMRQLAGTLHSYPAQSGAIRLAALAFVKNQPVAPW